jgi:hypothetical protein
MALLSHLVFDGGMYSQWLFAAIVNEHQWAYLRVSSPKRYSALAISSMGYD